MDEPLATQSAVEPLVEETSTPYLGRWNRLISTTNWEKGRILCEWRDALIAADAPPQSYSDEAWSRRVGQVSPQHVGRLRRVFARFGDTYEQYAGLYWSHFQAALDWPDAEMYLEGAAQSGWSVAQMRTQRWEAIGAPADKKPREADIIVTEWDEDVDAAGDETTPPTISESPGEVRGAGAAAEEAPARETPGPAAAESAVAARRPFEDLPPLPSDLDEAFEAFKLAILSHKVSGWQEISLDDVLAVLEALKQLALAPADG